MGTGPVHVAPSNVRGRYLLLEPRACAEPGVQRWAAYDPELARRVELCVVAIDGAERRRAVMQRARALASVAHRHVSAVLDIGGSDDAIHIASELVRGASLVDHCDAHALDGRAAWRSIVAAGRGLASAHALGVVHGGLRAESLRVDEGRACVVDFAIDTAGGSIAADVRAFAELALELLARRGAPARFAHALQPALQRGAPSLASLLDRAAARERRGSRVVLGAAGVAVIGGIFAWHPATDEAPACTGAARHLAGVWDDKRREQLHAQLERTAAPWAGDVERLMHDRLDAYGTAWVAAHGVACAATRIDHTQSEEVLEQRMACLHRHRVELAALVDTLVEADAAVLARAHDAAAGLADVRECADVEALDAAPKDPERADAIAAGLARARTLRDAGDYARALVMAAPWVGAAHAFGDGLLLARGEILLADLEDSLGAQDIAERTLTAGLWSAQRVHADREVAEAWIDTAWSLGFRRGDRNSGERACEHAAMALRRLGGDAELESKRLGTRGYLLEAAGAYDEAIASFEESLALAEQTMGADDPRLAQPLNGLAMTLKNKGEYDRSAAVFARTRELVRRTVGARHPQMAIVLQNIGNLQRARGRLDEAEAAHREALDIRLASSGEHSFDVAASYHNLGSLAMDRGDYDAAVASFERAEATFIALYGERHGHVGTVRNGLCFALYRKERYADARTACERALAVQTAAYGDDHPLVASTRTNLGLALDMLGDANGAIAQHRRALAIMEAKLGPEHPNLMTALVNLGEVLLAQGEAEAAIPLLERAVAIGAASGAANAALANAALGRSYARLRRFDDAIAPLERAIAMLEANGGEPEKLAEFRDDLADARRASRRASSSRD